MPVECPCCQWPSVLEERGPREDPSILLTGPARIGDTPVQIIAIRINPNLRMSSDRSEILVDRSPDAELHAALDTILEEFDYLAEQLGELFGEDQFRIVELATGPYQFWVVPVSFRAAGSE